MFVLHVLVRTSFPYENLEIFPCGVSSPQNRSDRSFEHTENRVDI